jgi:hypothetical protein
VEAALLSASLAQNRGVLRYSTEEASSEQKENLMACCLTPSLTFREDFTGTKGCKVTLRVKGPKDAGVALVLARYSGAAIDPPEFTIQAGAKFLTVLVEASKPGALVQLIETCDAGPEQVLDRFHFDPMNPARGYIVRGA